MPSAFPAPANTLSPSARPLSSGSRKATASTAINRQPASCESAATGITGARRAARPPLKSAAPHVAAALKLTNVAGTGKPQCIRQRPKEKGQKGQSETDAVNVWVFSFSPKDGFIAWSLEPWLTIEQMQSRVQLRGSTVNQ